MKKPSSCQGCPLYNGSTGFCTDYDPQSALYQVTGKIVTPKLALISRFPYKDDLVNGQPLTSKQGRYFEREFLWSLGLKREDVVISNVLRCYPDKSAYPTGRVKEQAVKFCRQYDAALAAFNPNVWVVTVHPTALMQAPNLDKFLRNDLRRARDLAAQGYRPAVLMGPEAREAFAPWLHGSMKKWRGHVYEYTYEWKEETKKAA